MAKTMALKPLPCTGAPRGMAALSTALFLAVLLSGAYEATAQNSGSGLKAPPAELPQSHLTVPAPPSAAAPPVTAPGAAEEPAEKPETPEAPEPEIVQETTPEPTPEPTPESGVVTPEVPEAEPEVVAEPAPEPAPEPTPAPAAGGPSVAFAEKSSELDDAGRAVLEKIAERMNANSGLRIQLLAYASSGGEDDDGRARRLSLARALNVRAFLIEKGIRSTRMEVRPLGAQLDSGQPDRVDIVPLEN